MSKPLIVIVGPTAVGKTAIALAMAHAIRGEVVSADSRQVYIGMNVGTAKPVPHELSNTPHHLVGYLTPDTNLSLAEYQQAAYAAIEDILAREKVPLLVGGSGQYVKAVVEGWGVPHVPPDAALRVTLETFASLYGSTALHARLAALDLVAAERIDWRNIRRVVRALEVCLLAGQPISVLQRKQAPPYRILWMGLTRPRSALYARIDARIEAMLKDGLVEEVRCLHAQGIGPDLPSMSALGYREIGQYLRGDITLEEAVLRMKRETRRFVRQQSTWFRADDARIHWFNLEQVRPIEVVAFARDWLARVD